MIKLKPIGTKLIVEPKPEQEKSSGGIIIPTLAREKTDEGTVVALGNGKPDDEHGYAAKSQSAWKFPFSAGDKVLFDKYGGREITQDGKKLMLLDVADVLAVIKERA